MHLPKRFAGFATRPHRTETFSYPVTWLFLGAYSVMGNEWSNLLLLWRKVEEWQGVETCNGNLPQGYVRGGGRGRGRGRGSYGGGGGDGGYGVYDSQPLQPDGVSTGDYAAEGAYDRCASEMPPSVSSSFSVGCRFAIFASGSASMWVGMVLDQGQIFKSMFLAGSSKEQVMPTQVCRWRISRSGRQWPWAAAAQPWRPRRTGRPAPGGGPGASWRGAAGAAAGTAAAAAGCV